MKTLNIAHVTVETAEEVLQLPLIERFVAQYGTTLVVVSREDGVAVEVVVEAPEGVDAALEVAKEVAKAAIAAALAIEETPLVSTTRVALLQEAAAVKVAEVMSGIFHELKVESAKALGHREYRYLVQWNKTSGEALLKAEEWSAGYYHKKEDFFWYTAVLVVPFLNLRVDINYS